ncbi:six-hairpin glycosidase-like protein [Hymenobacter crusticola]|uniref:Six-hairpin glycosidase-like protein n=1 Tax=Hymenobacter crusticola TaxID=1770526 RepID=A0A243WD94_9BACT|nr:six-hairpin glycosidase-like protein [Hymenobacter crusticola]
MVFASGCTTQSQAQDFRHQQELYWHPNKDNSITWDLTRETRLPHDDNIELAGTQIAAIIRYQVDQAKQVHITRDIIFPQLRKFTKSNESLYRAYLRDDYRDDLLPVLTLADKKYESGVLDSVRIKGKITFYFREKDGLTLVRSFFPSMHERCLVEKWTLLNTGKTLRIVGIGATELQQTEQGWHGTYHRRVFTDAQRSVTLPPGAHYDFGVYFLATLNEEAAPTVSVAAIERSRDTFLDSIAVNLQLHSPDPVLNTLFYFSKIRAAESIFRSRYGLVHSPGGGNYYVGIWANDQAEYSGPFFPYLGYQTGLQAALNAYRIFQRNLPKDGGKIWASFEMDVTFPFGERDRGDAAMIAFGATHFLLASGDAQKSKELWPLITWCLAYCRQRTTAAGVVASESDELEGRFPAGSANLATSCLYYGALLQAARLAQAMHQPASVSATYHQRAKRLATAIDEYFGAEMDGLHTYKYYKENTTLRSWICLPLVVGLYQRKAGTLAALFDKLWSANGVLTELKPGASSPPVFWDRGSLYAFRGAFKAGAADQALERLTSYVTTRLTGFRVPYAVEAWPENGMAHLSAESALYCRIFTEGILGLEPTGFHSFTLRPNLPSSWSDMTINNIKAFNTTFDVSLRRSREKLQVTVVRQGQVVLQRTVSNNTIVAVQLK